MTLRTLNYGNYGIFLMNIGNYGTFLIMGNAGFCPSAVWNGFWGLVPRGHGAEAFRLAGSRLQGFRLGFRV